MRLDLKNLVIAMERTGVSLRAAAIIANATLQDAGLITPNNVDMVITHSKLQRELRTWHDFQFNQKTVDKELTAVYFDGRKDKTLEVQEKGNKKHKREIQEEHVVILKEPSREYLGHVTPASGSSVSIKTALCDFFKSSETDLSKLCEFLCLY